MPVIESALALFQMQIKDAYAHAAELCHAALGIAPKALNAVDMRLVAGELATPAPPLQTGQSEGNYQAKLTRPPTPLFAGNRRIDRHLFRLAPLPRPFNKLQVRRGRDSARNLLAMPGTVHGHGRPAGSWVLANDAHLKNFLVSSRTKTANRALDIILCSSSI